jgi:hypothetical protein
VETEAFIFKRNAVPPVVLVGQLREDPLLGEHIKIIQKDNMFT